MSEVQVVDKHNQRTSLQYRLEIGGEGEETGQKETGQLQRSLHSLLLCPVKMLYAHSAHKAVIHLESSAQAINTLMVYEQH